MSYILTIIVTPNKASYNVGETVSITRTSDPVGWSQTAWKLNGVISGNTQASYSYTFANAGTYTFQMLIDTTEYDYSTTPSHTSNILSLTAIQRTFNYINGPTVSLIDAASKAGLSDARMSLLATKDVYDRQGINIGKPAINPISLISFKDKSF